MAHVITSLCLRDGGCVEVCPVACIVPGTPQDLYPIFYIDPDVCIDCGACIPECPFGAIFLLHDVPPAYVASEGEILVAETGTPGFTETYDGFTYDGDPVTLPATRKCHQGEIIDLTPDIQKNRDFFKTGPGYDAVGK